jgi:hypothetical protein
MRDVVEIDDEEVGNKDEFFLLISDVLCRIDFFFLSFSCILFFYGDGNEDFFFVNLFGLNLECL